MTIFYILIAVIVVVVLFVIGAFNGFVSKVNRTKEAWAAATR